MADEAVRAAAAGDPDARAALLEALQPRVRLMVIARVGWNSEQLGGLDELAQRVLAALVAGMGRLEDQTVEGLNAFVSGIVRNQVAAAIRQRTGERNDPERAVSLDTTIAYCSQAGPLWQFLSGSRSSPASAAERAEQIELLMAELWKLTTEQREVITLAFFDGLSVREIARQQGISRQAVSKLLLHAIRNLRRRMTCLADVGSGA